MFGRKKKPKSYLRCPYCGRKPVLKQGISTKPAHPIFQQECPKSHLRTGWLDSPTYALERWISMVSKYYDAESAIRQFCEQKKNE